MKSFWFGAHTVTSEQYGKSEGDADAVQVINYGIPENDIEIQPRKLDQSQITIYFSKTNLKQIKKIQTKSVTKVSQ